MYCCLPLPISRGGSGVKVKLRDLLFPQPKSKIKAGDGRDSGAYKFFTSSQSQTKFYDNALFKKPALIFGTGGMASVHYCNEPFSTSTDCLVMYGSDQINIELIYYYLYSNINLLQAGFKGAGLQHISKDYILNIEIDLPDLDIQDKIVNQMRVINLLIKKRKEQNILLDEAVKSRFIEMFCYNDCSKKWPIESIENISINTRTGPFGSALHHDEFVEKGVFVLGIDNAVENKFSYNRMRYISEEKYQQLKRYTVNPGDVIITIMGTVGKSAVIPEDIPRAINTKHLACITPNRGIVNPQFLSSVLQIHPEIYRQLKLQTKGAIMGGLNLGIIRNLKFPIAPLELQNQFVVFYNQVDKSKYLGILYINFCELIKNHIRQECV